MKKLIISSLMFSKKQIKEVYEWSVTCWIHFLYGWGEYFFQRSLAEK